MELRKLLAAALATALPFAALAQMTEQKPAEAKPTPPIAQLYGTLNVNMQYTEAGDATGGTTADVSPRTAISIDSTNIGVRGSLEVTPGLSVTYQCETQASLDGEALASLCNRNSRVGLTGGWGTLFYGNWDTPFKAGTYGTKADDPFGNTDVFGFNGIMGSPGFGVRSAAFNTVGTGATQNIATAAFDLRAGNSIAYWTPKFSGLSAKVQYAMNEFRSANGTVSPFLLSGAVNYDLAGLSLVAEAEYHEDAFGLRTITGGNAGTSASKDMAWRLAAGYELPLGVGALTVMGMFEQLLYEQEGATDVAADLDDYDRMAWLLGAKFRTGPHEFRVRYSQALEGNCTLADGTDCADADTADTGASSYAVGYAYHLAKSTQVYAFFTQIMNDDAARYTFGVQGAANVVAGNTPVGSDPLAGGVGIRFAFP
jgi:predicted porin